MPKNAKYYCTNTAWYATTPLVLLLFRYIVSCVVWQNLKSYLCVCAINSKTSSKKALHATYFGWFSVHSAFFCLNISALQLCWCLDMALVNDKVPHLFCHNQVSNSHFWLNIFWVVTSHETWNATTSHDLHDGWLQKSAVCKWLYHKLIVCVCNVSHILVCVCPQLHELDCNVVCRLALTLSVSLTVSHSYLYLTSLWTPAIGSAILSLFIL